MPTPGDRVTTSSEQWLSPLKNHVLKRRYTLQEYLIHENLWESHENSWNVIHPLQPSKFMNDVRFLLLVACKIWPMRCPMKRKDQSGADFPLGSLGPCGGQDSFLRYTPGYCASTMNSTRGTAITCGSSQVQSLPHGPRQQIIVDHWCPWPGGC